MLVIPASRTNWSYWPDLGVHRRAEAAAYAGDVQGWPGADRLRGRPGGEDQTATLPRRGHPHRRRGNAERRAGTAGHRAARPPAPRAAARSAGPRGGCSQTFEEAEMPADALRNWRNAGRWDQGGARLRPQAPRTARRAAGKAVAKRRSRDGWFGSANERSCRHRDASTDTHLYRLTHAGTANDAAWLYRQVARLGDQGAVGDTQLVPCSRNWPFGPADPTRAAVACEGRLLGPSSPWNKVAGGLTAVEGARI